MEFLALTVKERRNSASVKKLMALEVRSKVQRFEAIVLFDGVAEALKVFILKVDLVKAFVNGRNVLRLNRLKERSNQGNMASSLHNLDTLG